MKPPKFLLDSRDGAQWVYHTRLPRFLARVVVDPGADDTVFATAEYKGRLHGFVMVDLIDTEFPAHRWENVLKRLPSWFRYGRDI